jgi:sugar (pentulose or hexulose) kinase
MGTSATKAVVWAPDGLVAAGRAPLVTTRPQPGWAEQDPDHWWSSVAAACAQAATAAPAAVSSVSAIGLSGARETFVPVTEDRIPIGQGIVWSDRRAAAEAARLTTDLGGAERVRHHLGIVADAGSVIAKLAWLARHEPRRLDRARWLLAPRDLVAARLTGRIATDVTLASRTGLFTVGGEPAPETAFLAGDRLPPVLASTAIVGPCLPDAAAHLGVPAGIPIVIGAGDRACEVVGSDAGADRPMISWGTTANVSTPVTHLPDDLPVGVSVSAGALDGYLLEAGLSASGAALDWLAGITGSDVASLLGEASASGAGARGVIALPWLNGARAPWWRPGAAGAFVGLTATHGRGDLARAIVEGVALDLDRSLGRLAPRAEVLVASGRGSENDLWLRVLAATTGRRVERRSSAETAAAGACRLAAVATGAAFEVGSFNPRIGWQLPVTEEVEAYRGLRSRADRVAKTVVALDVADMEAGSGGGAAYP